MSCELRPCTLFAKPDLSFDDSNKVFGMLDQSKCSEVMDTLLAKPNFPWSSSNIECSTTPFGIALYLADLRQVAKIPNLKSHIDVAIPAPSIYFRVTPLFNLIDYSPLCWDGKGLATRVKVALDCFGASINIILKQGHTVFSFAASIYLLCEKRIQKLEEIRDEKVLYENNKKAAIARLNAAHDILITLRRKGGIFPPLESLQYDPRDNTGNVITALKQIETNIDKEIAESDAALASKVMAATTLNNSLANLVVGYAQDGLSNGDGSCVTA